VRPGHGKWARNARKTPTRGTPSRQSAHISSPNHGQRSFVQTFHNAEPRENEVTGFNSAKKEILVETFYPSQTSGRHGEVHVRPCPNQGYSTSLYVSCAKKMRDPTLYPVGTIFRLLVKFTDREGGGQYLYANPRDQIIVAKA